MSCSPDASDVDGDQLRVTEACSNTSVDISVSTSVLKELLLEREDRCVDFYFDTETALHMACSAGRLALVQLLLSAGAHVNCQTLDLKHTPLHNAAQKGHCDVVSYLLRNEAKATMKTLHRSTPLRLACLTGQVGVVKLLLTHCIELINVGDRQGRTPLITAIEHGHEDVVHCLIECRANVNVSDCMRRSPVFYAVRRRYSNILKQLIDAGADVNVYEKHLGMSPLRYAARFAFVDMSKQLLDSGRCDVNLQAVQHCGTHVFTALMEAVHKGNLSSVKQLLDYGADPNQHSVDGIMSSALYAMLLSNHCSLDIAHALLEAGLYVSVQNRYGYSALHFAVDKEWLPLAHLIVSADCDLRLESDWINITLQTPNNGHFSEEIWNFIKDLARDSVNFCSMKKRCRMSINSSIHNHYPSVPLYKHVSQLPLPRQMIDYLLYRRA